MLIPTCPDAGRPIRQVSSSYRSQAAHNPKAPIAQTARSAIAVGAGLACFIPMKYTHAKAYNRKAAAPAIMERASIAAYNFPWVVTVSVSVASATDGAAPNSPAKPLGFNTSAVRAKSEKTRAPPHQESHD